MGSLFLYISLFLSSFNPTKVSGAYTCSGYVDAESCKNDACLWDNAKQVCMSRYFTVNCFSIKSEEICNAVQWPTGENKCAWNENSQCIGPSLIISSACSYTQNETVCKRMSSCVWDNSGFCLNKKFSMCTSATEKESCLALDCIWDDYSKCLSPSFSYCFSSSEEESCSKLNCHWDKAKRCLSEYYSWCHSSSEEKTCENIGCIWDSQTACLSPTYSLCRSAKTEPTCKSLSCIWNKKHQNCSDYRSL